MAIGRAARKATVTLPEEQVDAIKALVRSGHVASVSGFVQHAVGVSLDDVVGWGVMLADAPEATGGPLTEDEREWADRLLGVPRTGFGSVA